MAVAALPDMLGALLGQLRSYTDLQALVGNPPRIRGELHDDWNPMPRHAIVLKLRGGPGEQGSLPLMRSRLDMTCYGSTALEAMRLWRTAHPLLCPPQPYPRSFVRSACSVLDVAQEAAPIPLTDPDTSWPYVVTPYIVRWCTVPTA